MIKPTVTWTAADPEVPAILTTPTRPVEDFTSEEFLSCVRDLNDSLDETIRVEGNKRGATGLSANQIGIGLAVSAVQLGAERVIFVDPELAEERGYSRLFRIGCFSLPGVRGLVRYNDDVVVKYKDENGLEKEVELKGDRSCVVQHEMDHLKGLLVFDRTGGKERLFVPRQSLYKDGKVPLSNWGPVAEAKRRKGTGRIQTPEVYYSSLFNDYTDYQLLAQQDARTEREFLGAVRRATPAGGYVLEVGRGTGTLAAVLANEGYSVMGTETDFDLKDLAERVAAANLAPVMFFESDGIALPEGNFDTVFSRELLETLEEKELERALKAGLAKAKTYVFKTPLLSNRSNALKGDEILRTGRKWKKLLASFGLKVKEALRTADGQMVFAVTE